MDGFAMTSLLSVAIELTCSFRGGELQCLIDAEAPKSPLPSFTHLNVLAIQTDFSEELANGKNLADIWDDHVAIACLRDNVTPPPSEVARVNKRKLHYVFRKDGELMRRFPDGTTKIVPPPDRRVEIAASQHELCGHFGEKRTRNLVLTSYWWVGVSITVAKVVKACGVCDRVHQSFNTQNPTMTSVPIHGMFYRWGVDLLGLPTSDKGYKWVMVMIEYFSKHIELVPLKTKEAEETRAAFLSHVLARYGACAEVLTDNGLEFQGAFHDLTTECLIDHRLTSPNHPQANGLTERCVQTVKEALRKMCDDSGTAAKWEEHLQWVALGYRCSICQATGFSPYQLLYARQPVIPPATMERLECPLNFDNPTVAGTQLLQRVHLLRQSMPMAMDNIEIAQHRDTLRYARVRTGAYMPKLRKFDVGDFVYVRRRNLENNLQISSHPEILRVVEVRALGTLLLEGRCGSRIVYHSKNCAPCHLPNIDPTVDPLLARIDPKHRCEHC
jgi:transposase InsO family protein